MSNRDIQRILKDIPRDTLSVAMKTWDRELRRLVCGNLPRHVEGIVTSNMERIDCGEKETEDANAFILDLIRRLADDAEIFTRG